jgi:pimeloyl-ACP methyl ester carboxylesterase
MIRYVEYITPEEYMALRKMVGWVEFPLEQAQACIDKAYMILGVRDDEKAIGVVRLLWDGGYIAFLSDVIVDPEYQGQGIGRKLVEASIGKLKAGMKPGYKVKLTLNSAIGKEAFYEKFGFRVRPNEDAGPGMDQWLIKEESAMKEFYIDSDGIRLHAKLDRVNENEKGPLCILIHGFTGHMEEDHIIAAQKAMNEAGVSVLRVEMYGHGKSDGQFKDHTLYKWVTNALAAVHYAKELDFVTDLYLCGHSQGGLLTMLIAGMCPDAFKAVIPLSPAWMIPEICRQGSVLGTEFDPLHIPDEVGTADWTLSGDYIRVAQTIHVEDEIARYHGPVLIIHGDEDEAVPYAYGVKAAELYENAKLVTIHGDDHCYTRHLNEMAEALKAFFDGERA